MSVPVTAGTANPLLRWSYIPEQWDRIQEALLQHIQLTLLAVVCGFVISALLAFIALHYRWTMTPITLFAAFLYTIPGVAFFGILVAYLGLSLPTALIPLTSFTILILVTNIMDGFQSVPDPVREAADGMGLTPTQRLFTVEIPIAVPYIINGLRIATVTTVGLVTVAAIIGYGGLGRLILDGLRRAFWTPLTIGASLSILLALLFDLLFFALGAWLTPWARRRQAGGSA